MGWFKRKVKRSEDLRADGIRATARIEELELLDRGERQVNVSPEDLMAGTVSVTGRPSMRKAAGASGKTRCSPTRSSRRTAQPSAVFSVVMTAPQ